MGNLFGKHKKLEQQRAFLRTEVFYAAVGTPGRVARLLESGDLALAEAELCVLDATWRDAAKGLTLFEQPEGNKELGDLLRLHLLPACAGSALRIGVV